MQTKNILLIDDDNDVRSVLADTGMCVAPNVLAGLQRLDQGGIKMVLCDIEGIAVGGLNHYDVLTACIEKSITFVCVSGNYDLAREMVADFGIDAVPKYLMRDYLLKKGVDA